ncbi:hypothetical protein [Aliarcobacter skirrowii]|jgi:hypothetical protein|uniref:Uncharacterized protein n=2 Tax=Aliarcobacter skirrowii TaxID=28200 RepID=A0AAD0SM90_9BACT|nr:hypothetical protein [Aliarcobacter skirrowii]AXX85399.1 hypothetical protein ASKIR_1620 [Aliarcobacter skirrowii CCUG 10374]AZL54466.1 hypothetical protein EI285_07735 [Aliarcobacter skirrowii]KAB0621189.1 hypothetical protein F7P70_05450 [Aliarcobacter skirrowii CCUG 10374]MDD2508137.1 hypothetical protein [Aliarcobacter skirrowii]MDD3025909.1 hypothetical protein [Aliarcobacter skirrowii]
MKLLLICNTAIIEHIFNLVCKRLGIDLNIERNTKFQGKFDFIVVDQPFIGSDFLKLKRFTKKLAAINSEELSYDLPSDFVVPRPFLPTKLEAILKEQIKILKDEIENGHNFDTFKDSLVKDNYIEDSQSFNEMQEKESDLAEDFFETLIEDDFDDGFFRKNDLDDESIVSLNSIRQGGVLDKSELKKINSFLDDKSENIQKLEERDWKDITDIIDDALDEVKDYEFDLEKEDYTLVLNRFKMDELKPLLLKLNQNIIDRLARNEVINLKISLKGE